MISGCSGGGKSTLLKALQQRAHNVVEEPGRRIVAEELAKGGSALPWVDLPSFARRAIELARTDWEAAQETAGRVFFDRGLIDAAAALQHWAGESVLEPLAARYCYNRQVFLAPPWPEIYAKDNERRHDLAEAVNEYQRLRVVYPALGYDVRILPKISVAERVDFIIAILGENL